ncbi:hypothetical protein MKX01_037213 [Papaver californicum]|nr:hypothetical protein MKX01_037213 [Papaver californicum]
MDQIGDVTVPISSSLLKATLCLGEKKYFVDGTNIDGVLLSDQLVSMKQASMSILKEFITKHNIPADVPDEAVKEEEEEDNGDVAPNNGKTKKRK